MDLPGLDHQLGDDIDALRDAVRAFESGDGKAERKLVATMTATIMTVLGRADVRH